MSLTRGSAMTSRQGPRRASAVQCVPCTTIIEASWLYGHALDELASLPRQPTVVGKLRALSHAFEALVEESRERCTDGVSADDLVPLLTLLLVATRIDVPFEGFVLDLLPCDALASGRESYCACTLAVALGFLRQVAA